MGNCVSRLALAATFVAASDLLGASVAFAQEAAAEAVSSGDEIVVTAQRRNQNIQDVPISLQAISGADLAEKGIAQMQDLQKTAPNVTISTPLGQGAAPAINIRGIGLNDFNSNNSGPNGVYVDEFAISSPNAQGASFFDIERIEVLKGPQGTLYGRNASGGAINITTVRPSQDFSAKAHVAYSSFDSFEAEAAIGGGISPTLSGRLSGIYRYSDGFMYNHLYDRRENGINLWGLRGQLLFEPTSQFTALLKGQVVRNESRAPMYKHFGAFDANGALCSVEDTLSNVGCTDLYGYAGREGFWEGDWNNGNDKVLMTDYNATLRMAYNFDNGIDLVSVTGYNLNRRFHPEQTDANPFQLLEIDYNTRSREFTQELRLSGDSDVLNWVVGAYYINENIRQNQPSAFLTDADTVFHFPGAVDGVAEIQQTMNNQRTHSEALFGQFEFKATDRLSLIAGARYTWENKDFDASSSARAQMGGEGNYGPPFDVTSYSLKYKDKNFSWRLGVNYKINPDLMLFATASTGYKAGGFNGGFLSSDPAERLAQLQPFKAETVTAYEAGFKSQFADRRVTFNASFFYNIYKDQQVSVLRLIPDPAGGLPDILFSLSNADRARIYGVDAELSVRPVDGLSLSAQVGYLNAKFTDFVSLSGDFSGNRLSLAPKLTTTLGAEYEVPIGASNLRLRYDATYRSKQFFEPGNDPYLFQNGYWLHNARVGVSFADDKYEVAVFGRNLAKKKYLIWNAALFDPFGVATGTVGEPRVLGVEFNLKY